jgi:hypothetical protein
MSRLDAMIARDFTDRDGNNKTAWTRIGTAWPAKQGTGYSIVLEALPLPSMSSDGKLECRILLREPIERDVAPRNNGTPARSNRADDLDGDSVPFLTMHDRTGRLVL